MFLSLVSGSSGNASIIKNNDTTILVDCGLSGKKLMMMLDELDIRPDEIDALLITHEHIDHTMGAGVVSRRFNIPIYATKKTHEAMDVGKIRDESVKIIQNNMDFEIGTIGISPFSLSHDAKDPVGYSFFSDGKKYSLATDMGIMSDDILNKISGSDYLMLEANHDVDMLRFGEYPYPLKQRILSDVGHLSNVAAAQTAVRLVQCGTEQIMLGHLSDKNNLPEIAMMETYNLLNDNGISVGKDVTLQVAERYDITRFI